MQTMDKKRLGLYLHIPFCRSKCAYCDFFSLVPSNEDLVERYINALILHMHSYRTGAKDYAPDTVFIGGGTPTSIGTDMLLKLIRAVRRNFSVIRGAEWTVEANPATVDVAMLNRLRRAGVNRLSMGLQSANNNELAALSRIHRRQDFEASFRAARRARIGNINVDLMFGIPYQTRQSFLKTLRYVVHLGPEHVSLYDLMLEPGTQLYAQRQTLPFPSEDEEVDMYLTAVDFLAQHGYAQYEISNFARPGYMCRHNLKYWNCEEYLGLGVAAHSFFMGNRFSFIRNLDRYMNGLEIPSSAIRLTDQNDAVSPRERLGEYIMLRFRLAAGLNVREFARLFGVSFEQLYGRKMQPYIQGGYATYKNGVYALTPKGMFVSNYILSDILEFADLGQINMFDGTR
jgi:oxygen-independent coproporphyrinogen-3 oxidase